MVLTSGRYQHYFEQLWYLLKVFICNPGDQVKCSQLLLNEKHTLTRMNEDTIIILEVPQELRNSSGTLTN